MDKRESKRASHDSTATEPSPGVKSEKTEPETKEILWQLNSRATNTRAARTTAAAFEIEDNISAEKKWRISVSRARKSLDTLGRRGYEPARALRAVLYGVDRLLSVEFKDEQRNKDRIYRRASIILRRARKSKQLKNLITSREIINSDPACALLKRAIAELEQTLGTMRKIDLQDQRNVDLIRNRVTSVLLSVLCAEAHAINPG